MLRTTNKIVSESTSPAGSRAQRLRLGFCAGGGISSRTAMVGEMLALMQAASPGCGANDFRTLIVEQDVLQKASASNRTKTFGYMRRLYALDPAIPLFREYRRLLPIAQDDTVLLTGLLAMAREPILRSCLSMVLQRSVGSAMSREDFETWIRDFAPGRFSQSMYLSFSHNLYASFFQLGYLSESVRKARARRRPGVGAATVAFSAFLDWLSGVNGLALLEADYSRALELAPPDHIDRLIACGRQGLLTVAYAGGVLHLDFPGWLQPGEARLNT